MARPRVPRKLGIESVWLESTTDWTVEMVKAALAQHERAIFRQSTRLADAMDRNARISGSLDTRVRALTSRGALPFRVEPADYADGRRRLAVARRQEQLWWHTCPEEATGPIDRDGIRLGAGLGYLTWDTSTDEWIPRLNWLPTHGLELEAWGLYGTDRRSRWRYTAWNGEQFEVTPGDGTWFLYLPWGPQSWMHGSVRFTAMQWLGAAFTERDWNRYDEKHGLAILDVTEPYWATDEVEGVEGSNGTKADEYYAQFRTLGTEAVLRNPQGATKDEGGWAARFLEPMGNSSESFEKHLEYLNDQFEYAILGGVSSGQPRGGDGEIAKERVRVESLTADAETLATALREQVWKPWAEYNYGDRDLAGWGRWDTRPAPDMRARADTLKTMSEAVQVLATLNVDTAPILAEFGIAGRAEVPEPTPAPAPEPEDEPEDPADIETDEQ